MARFDVYADDGMLLLDVQTNLIRGLGTRLVVPLLPAGQTPPALRKLHPVFTIGGLNYVMATHLMSTAEEHGLGKPVLSLDKHYDAIVAAVDMVFLGF